MPDPIETSELLAFVRSVDAQSVSRAAQVLGVPRATVSRRLARLEEALGVRLARRTTRSFTLTDAGQAFYVKARVVLEAVSAAEASVQVDDTVVRGTLRVSVPTGLPPSFHLMVAEFMERFPDVKLFVQFSSQMVDLARGDYDVALRASSVIAPGLVARTLFREKSVAVAAPSYLEERGTPRNRRDLKGHRFLMNFGGGESPQIHWPLLDGGQIHLEGAFFTNSIFLACDAARRGLGIALLPNSIVEAFIENGELVKVLPNVLGADGRVAVVYAERALQPPQVRAFIDAVHQWGKTGFDSNLRSWQLESLVRPKKRG